MFFLTSKGIKDDRCFLSLGSVRNDDIFLYLETHYAMTLFKKIFILYEVRDHILNFILIEERDFMGKRED